MKNEVMTLTGTVDFYFQRVAAEKTTQRIAGVKGVAVDIDVKGAESSNALTDANIAEAIRNALTWHHAVSEDLIDIEVDDGWVYLDGAVQWDT